jgi:hypothetical protein
LVLALYGHPDSGGYWERHCHKHLTSVGFAEIAEWRSCYVHPKLGLFLVVYVDDFKMAGPTKNLSQGWSLIRKGVKTDDPQPLGKYLGCSHTEHVGGFAPTVVPEQWFYHWPPNPEWNPPVSAGGGLLRSLAERPAGMPKIAA